MPVLLYNELFHGLIAYTTRTWANQWRKQKPYSGLPFAFNRLCGGDGEDDHGCVQTDISTV